MNEIHNNAKNQRRFAGIEIPPELKPSHFFNLYLATLAIAVIAGVTGILQPAFLKDVINIPKEQAGTINSGLQNMSAIATLLFVGISGILSDRIGRIIPASIGLLIAGTFFIIFGHAKEISLFFGITHMEGQIGVTYIIRFILGIGLVLSWPQFTTLVADYTYEKDRGKAMAINGTMMAIGSIIVFGVLAQIARKAGLMTVFYIAGLLNFVALLITRTGLVERMPEGKAEKAGFREIYRIVKKSPSLKATYLSTLIARMDIGFITIFFIVWLVYAGEKAGMSSVEATARGSVAMIVMSVASLLAFPLIGYLLDKWGRVQVLISSLVTGGLGLIFMALTEDPFSPLMNIFVPLVALGFAGNTVAGLTLTSDVSPKKYLGSVLGGLNTMMPLGLVFVQLGGFLLDEFGYWAPFLMKGLMDFVCVGYILIFRKSIMQEKHGTKE